MLAPLGRAHAETGKQLYYTTSVSFYYKKLVSDTLTKKSMLRLI